NLVEVASGARRISEHRFHLLVRPYDIYRTHGEYIAHLGVNHVVESRDLLISVGNDRIVEAGALGLFDVHGPLLVRLRGVDTQAYNLDAALVELRFELGHITKFRGADGGEVLGVREEDRPTVANPLVEAADRTFARLRAEIRNYFTNTQCHDFLLRNYGLINCRWDKERQL